MRKLFGIILLLLLTSPLYAKDFATEFPTGVALEVVTPTSGDATYLKLDQSTPQTTTGNFQLDQLEVVDSHIIYVPAGDGVNDEVLIRAYIAASNPGDTLVLASGPNTGGVAPTTSTYILGDRIYIDKSINIVGQGVGQTIISCATANKTMFANFGGVDEICGISNLSLYLNAANITGIYYQGITILNNVNIETGASATTCYGIFSEYASGTSIKAENVHIYGVAGTYTTGMSIYDGSAFGGYIVASYLKACRVTAGCATGFSYQGGGTLAGSNAMRIYDSVFVGSTTGFTTTGGYTSSNLFYNTIFSGGTTDVVQTGSHAVTLSDCTLQNGTTSGTITRDGEVNTEDLYASNNLFVGNTLNCGADDDPCDLYIHDAGGIWIYEDSDDFLCSAVCKDGAAEWQFNDDVNIGESGAAENLYVWGNCGIGTNSPDTLLHLNKDNATAIMRLERNQAAISSSDILARIEVETQDTDDPGLCASIEALSYGTAGETGWRFKTGTPSAFVETMQLDPYGYLGLGTPWPDSPDALLHIQHATDAYMRLTRADDTVTAGEIIGRFEFENQDTGSSGIAAYIQAISEGTGGETALSFGTGTSGTLAERLRIDTLGGIDWLSGNVIFVPLGGDIATYITAATAGDTLVLAAGTYTITSMLSVNKKLHIMGQGEGITTTTSASDIVMIDMASAGSRLSNMTISATGARTLNTKSMIVINADCDMANITFTNTATGSTAVYYPVIYTNSASTVNIENCTSSATGAIGFHPFLYSKTAGAITNIRNCEVVGLNGTTNTVANLTVFMGTAAGTINLYDSQFKDLTAPAAASGGCLQMGFAGGNMNVYNCTANSSGASAFDVKQTAGTLTLYDTKLVNNTTSGTITYRSWTAWTPSLVWGAGTPASITTVARYTICDGYCKFKLYITSADSNGCSSLTATLPITPKDVNSYTRVASLQLNDATYLDPMGYIDQLDDTGTNRLLKFYSFATVADGRTVTIEVSGEYEI